MKTAFLILLLAASPAAAAGSACPQFFAGGAAPTIEKPSMAARTAELCYGDFSVMHSGITAGPLWSAEHLTAAGVVEAKKVPRVDQFFAEPRIPAADRAELSHYRGSGYDRGHMAPSADMTTDKAQAESFSLANMVPQDPNLNRKLWADIESTARGLALSYGEVYVVTGPAFNGERLKRLGGRVLVPTATFKAIYVPSQKASAAWWADNTGVERKYEVISIEELGRRLSVDVFPALPAETKAVAARLPAPKARSDSAAGTRPPAEGHRSTAAAAPAEGPSWGGMATQIMIGAINRMLK
jgi:endonuclease G